MDEQCRGWEVSHGNAKGLGIEGSKGTERIRG